MKLGNELAPELSRKLHLEFSHISPNTRVAPSILRRRHGRHSGRHRRATRGTDISLYVFRAAGLHARAVVKAEADHRDEMARSSTRRHRSWRNVSRPKIAHYEKWDFVHLPATTIAEPEFFESIADALDKKTGGIDVGFGWRVHDAIRLDRAELLDAFAELEPLYRVLRSVS